MRTICWLIIIFILLIFVLRGGTVTLGWEAQPSGIKFKVWHGVDLKATVETNQATIEIPEHEVQTIRVTAFANGYGESTPAEIKLVPVTLQKSTDLVSWTRDTTRYFEFKEKEFFRLALPHVNPK